MGAHTSLPRAAMGGWSALAPFGSKGVPSWKPEDLFVELTDDDVLVRHDDGRLLGSLLHTWNVALNTHRLEFFGTAHHSPRLRVGRVVVQRESWLIDPGDRVRKEVHESGPRLLVGIRRMQRANHLPREVFVRPVLSSRMTLHKDAKPIFVDFDVPFSVEMLGGMVRKFLQLRVAEVQPRLEDAWLQDSRGRYCSEFRMIANPA
jgi:hypothetical protein